MIKEVKITIIGILALVFFPITMAWLLGNLIVISFSLFEE